MSSRRTLILMAAIVVGALAAYAIYSYVGSLEDEANENARRVEAVRVVSRVTRGTPGVDARNAAQFEEILIPQELVTGAEIDQSELDAGLIDDKIAASDLVAGQILVEGMFVDPLASRVTGAARIPDDNVAITIQVDQVRGVAGLIVPGDFINIMALPKDICTGDAAAVEGGAGAGSQTVPAYGTVDPPTGVPGDEVLTFICTPASMLYQAVQVLFVDRSPVPLPGELTSDQVNADGSVSTATSTNTGLLTLAVPVEAAQLLASIDAASFYLTLLPPTYVPGPVPDYDPIIELLPGEDPAQLTPYGPQGYQPNEEP